MSTSQPVALALRWRFGASQRKFSLNLNAVSMVSIEH
jgi:hypothetical protein